MATQTKVFDLLKADALAPITADLEASVGGLVAAAVADITLESLGAGSAATHDAADFDPAGAAAAITLSTLGAGTAATHAAEDFDPAGSAAAVTLASLGAGSAASADVADFDPAGAAAAITLASLGAGSAASADVTDFDPAGAAAAVTLASLGAEPTQTAASQAEAEAGTGTAIRSWTPARIWQAIVAKLAAGVSLLINDHRQTPIRLYITAGVLDAIELGKGPYYCKVASAITTVNITAAASGTVGNAVVYFHHDGSAAYAVAMPGVVFPNRVSGAFVTSSGLIYRADFATVPVPDGAWTAEGRVIALGAI